VNSTKQFFSDNCEEVLVSSKMHALRFSKYSCLKVLKQKNHKHDDNSLTFHSLVCFSFNACFFSPICDGSFTLK